MTRKDSLLRLEQHGIQRIPAGWAQSRVKYLGAYINGYPFKPDDWSTVGRPILRIQDLSSANQEPNRYDGEIPSRYLVRPRDILISWSASLGVYRWVGEEAWLNQHIFKVALDTKRIRDEFFVWLAEWFINEMDREVHGSTMQHLTADAFGGFPVLLPPHEDQVRIATYLDRETVRLDTLVAAKERVLGLLAEKRRALITRAVTRGLDPRVPLRDSGTPWLGEIPAHWATRRLRFASPQITVGIVVTPAKYYEASGVPCLRSLNVRETGLTDSDLVYISDESNILHSKSRVYTGDLVAVRSGQPGTTAVVDRRFEGANCIDLIIIRRSPLFASAFLAHFLNSEPAKMQFLSGSGGAIQQHFNIETAADLVVPVPPLGEQRMILAHIAKVVTQLDALRAANERTIALLKERRAALIAAAVTGKIKVEGAAWTA